MLSIEVCSNYTTLDFYAIFCLANWFLCNLCNFLPGQFLPGRLPFGDNLTVWMAVISEFWSVTGHSRVVGRSCLHLSIMQFLTKYIFVRNCIILKQGNEELSRNQRSLNRTLFCLTYMELLWTLGVMLKIRSASIC